MWLPIPIPLSAGTKKNSKKVQQLLLWINIIIADYDVHNNKVLAGVAKSASVTMTYITNK